jgi:hypothetical protein
LLLSASCLDFGSSVDSIRTNELPDDLFINYGVDFHMRPIIRINAVSIKLSSMSNLLHYTLFSTGLELSVSTTPEIANLLRTGVPCVLGISGVQIAVH